MREYKGMRDTIIRAVLILVVFVFITGIVYPLAMTLVSQVAFSEAANGNLVESKGTVIGSRLIGQSFSGMGWFESRPSAVNYTADGSGASNMGPADPAFIDGAARRAQAFRDTNGLANDTPVPADMVLASGSGLDPHISLDAALLQVPRVARERGLPEPVVRELVRSHREPAGPEWLGQPRVNVLLLNIDLERLQKEKQ
jgi:potassium-transporting ATPase KdpC subunit